MRLSIGGRAQRGGHGRGREEDKRGDRPAPTRNHRVHAKRKGRRYRGFK